jgi:uncharacterized protein
VIVLDTTVLAYAVGVDHPLQASSRQLVRAIADGAVTATTTIEVIERHPRSARSSRVRVIAGRRQ